MIKFLENKNHESFRFIRDDVVIRTYEFDDIIETENLTENSDDNIIIEEFSKEKIILMKNEDDFYNFYKCKFIWSSREIYENESYINTSLIDVKDWFISILPKLNSIIASATEDANIKSGYYDAYLTAISKLKTQTTIINFEDGFTIEVYYINKQII